MLIIRTNDMMDAYLLKGIKPKGRWNTGCDYELRNGLQRIEDTVTVVNTKHKKTDPLFINDSLGFERWTNNLLPTQKLDMTIPTWEGRQEHAIIHGLTYKMIVTCNKLFKLFHESNCVYHDDQFYLRVWIDHLPFEHIDYYKPKDIASGFCFNTIRCPEDDADDYFWTETQANMSIHFNKQTYAKLQPDWWRQHILKKQVTTN